MKSPQKYRVIGLMSGTSVDGLDIAYCEFSFSDSRVSHFEILKATTVAYPDDLKSRLINSIFCDGLELTKLDIDLGHWIGSEATNFIADNSIEICVIASHGHTVFHQPENGFTLQIGNGNEIHKITGFPVIFDFRTLDVANGGQGAPLVPIGDKLLFSEYDVCLNIGGFANISYDENGIRKAFDICATNIVMNELTQSVGKEYDDGGKMAAGGIFITDLEESLSKLEYYQLPAPKSIGKEWVEKQIMPIINSYSSYEVSGILHTYATHIGKTIGNTIDRILNTKGGNSKILITGGGAYNGFVIQKIQEYCPGGVIIIPDKKIINYKEALVFGLMGILRQRNKNNCLKSVTGALSDTSGGTIVGPLQPSKLM